MITLTVFQFTLLILTLTCVIIGVFITLGVCLKAMERTMSTIFNHIKEVGEND